ncbi:fructosamine kinase family protein [Actinopolymorpha sp. B17G11]|uniref:fructosamine kinase family protein n=1 Tax=Actinopolymorpha sp. B17G11 TaxID=3160861 RepID=UPI0032E43394
MRGHEGLDAAVLLLRRQGMIAEGESVTSRRLSGGTIAQVVLVAARDGRRWVVKHIPGLPASALAAEVEGLSALGASGTVAVPRVHHQGDDAIVMEALHPADGDSPTFWQRLGQDIAGLHAATRTDRHGWRDDNWLGGLPQHNGWEADGHRFFVERRVLRFLGEPRVRQVLSAADRQAIEHFCRRLPDLVPVMPAVLLHGDLGQHNVLAGPTGRPTLIDPAVCYGWAELDISIFWMSSSGQRSSAVDRFFAAWQEAAAPEPGWKERAPLLSIPAELSVLAEFGDVWGTADHLRATVAPFRRQAQAIPANGDKNNADG